MPDLPETRYAQSGDVNIAYQVIGDGPRDLIFVPGIISNVEFFHQVPGYTDFLHGLGRFARVVIFDKRGNGLSDRIAGAPTLEDRMDDIRAVMEATSSEQASLFAVSEGGPISLLFAATYPERVHAIVLYETFVRYGGVSDYPIGMERDSHQTLTETMVEHWGTGLSLFGFGTSQSSDPHIQALWGQAERSSNSPGGFRTLYELLHDVDVRPALQSVQAPCLVIHGEGSMFAQHGQYLADHLPNARLKVMPAIDHFPWFAGGERIVAEVEEFLTGARTAAAGDRVLATVLFTDIVGSTDRAAQLGDRKWRQVLSNHDDLVRRQLQRFRGKEIKTTGDGFLATFDGPARAIRCAQAITEAVQGLGLQVRAGLHTGEVEVTDGDIGGIAVHIASRVLAYAGAGEVMISSSVPPLVVGSGIEFDDRGKRELRGVPGSWKLFTVTG